MPRVSKSFKPASPVSTTVGSPREAEQDGPKEENSAPIKSGSVDELVGTDEYGYRPRYGNNGGYQNGDSPRFAPASTQVAGEAGRYSGRERDVPTEEVSGILDIMPEGHGFLRPKYIPSDQDIYISASQIRRFNLRSGDLVEGAARPPKETERYFGLKE